MNAEAALQVRDSLTHPLESSVERSSAQCPINFASSRYTSDEDLIRAIASGDRAALGSLFQRHGRTVLNIASRIVRDQSEADDLRQDVFLFIFQRAHLFDPSKGTALSWVSQVTYHRAFDRRRFLNVRQHYKTERFDERLSGSTVPSTLSADLDGRSILLRLRGQLSKKQQETLELYFFEGYTFREIAEKSGQTLGNVRHHYYRALECLRSNLFSKKPSRSERIR
jgi:RNA polymerase sigma-70 factor (ECF subfamily)